MHLILNKQTEDEKQQKHAADLCGLMGIKVCHLDLSALLPLDSEMLLFCKPINHSFMLFSNIISLTSCATAILPQYQEHRDTYYQHHHTEQLGLFFQINLSKSPTINWLIQHTIELFLHITDAFTNYRLQGVICCYILIY